MIQTGSSLEIQVLEMMNPPVEVKEKIQKVLVVDNEPAIVEMLEMLLEEDYKVATCTDSTIALGLVNELHPDIILLDLMMPNPDGIAILKILRQNPALPNIPVVLMTAGTTYCSLSNDELNELNASLIAKPFDNTQLLELISRVAL